MSEQLHYEDVHEGTPLPTLEKTPTTRQLVMYAGASGDFYEIHYDSGLRARGRPPKRYRPWGPEKRLLGAAGHGLDWGARHP